MIEKGKYGCEDDFSGSSEPTCGWQLDPVTGEKIENSQGFCCECDLVSFLGNSPESTRGSECEMFNFGDAASSAHCLRFSRADLDYKAYSVQAPRLDYQIDLYFSVATTEGSIDSMVSLGQAQRNALAAEGKARVELVGDLQTFQ